MWTIRLIAAGVLAVASATHYGDPCSSAGCAVDEQAVSVTGLDGSFCSPDCTKAVCPTDVPAGTTTTPTCALTAPSGAKACALVCSPSAAIKDQKVADAACGAGASCKPIQGTGICTYDDCGASPSPTPPPAPTPPTPAPALGDATWAKTAHVLASIAVGAGMGSDNAVYVGGGDNGVGAEVFVSKNGGDNFTPFHPANGTVLLLDAAAQSATLAIVTGVAGVEYTSDGKTWTHALDFGGGQSAETIGTKGFGVTSGTQLHILGDDGHVFKNVKIAGVDTGTYPGRYGAFPSETTWYVSAGQWPQSAAVSDPTSLHAERLAGSELVHELSEVIQIRRDAAGVLYHHMRTDLPGMLAADAAKAANGGLLPMVFTLLSARANATHYGNPFNGPCLADEKNITGLACGGAICAPKGTGLPGFKKCPKDVPEGMDDKLISAWHNGYCVSHGCKTNADCGVDPMATCSPSGNSNECTYTGSSAPTPAPAPTPPTPPTPVTPAPTPAPAPGTAYTGAIFKTTDAGATWTTQYSNNGGFYFNGIHCETETHCIAVGEAHGAGGEDGVHIFTTFDGKTWEQTLFDPNAKASGMGARLTSSTEGWVAGGVGGGVVVTGHFYHTTDGGKSWALEKLPGMSAIGLDCADATPRPAALLL